MPKGGSRVNAPKIGTGGVKKSKVGGGESAAAVPSLETYWSVVWCKRSNKKHKTWEDDAVLVVKGRSATLKDLEGKTISVGSQVRLRNLGTAFFLLLFLIKVHVCACVCVSRRQTATLGCGAVHLMHVRSYLICACVVVCGLWKT